MKPKIACPVPAKRGWANKCQADQALGLIWRKGFRRGPGKLPTRSYHCSCGQWHLTSQSYDSNRRLT